MPKILELCSGTAQISNYFLAQGWEVVTIDSNAKFNPTICSDIRQINYTTLWQPGEFDVIWASPPCTEYSIAKSTGTRDFQTADQIVRACFDIIEHLSNCENDVAWFCENPATGYLRTRPCMQDYNDEMNMLCYCKYGTPYRKATCIWTNIDTWVPRPMCFDGCRCAAYTGTHHPKSAQKGPSKIQGATPTHDNFKTTELYGVPYELVRELFACVGTWRADGAA